jgi:LruC domain-containing protein
MKVNNKLAVLTFFSLSPFSQANQSFGSLESNNIDDDAIVCMTIGLQASVNGLDNLTLTATGIDGDAGTVYQSTDEFNLESNGGVTLMASSNPMTYAGNEINTFYLIDGQLHSYSTENNAIHSSNHSFTGLAQLGNISSQLAGEYTTTVFLTVVPNLGVDGGCGQQSFTRPVESSNWAFIAYEDLYPNPGDADYNDFVMAFQSTESYNASGELETINMSFLPVARGAGYNHSAHLDLNGEIWKSNNVNTITDEMFNGDAVIKATYTNMTNGTEIEKYYSKDRRDVVLFDNTRVTLDGFANVYDNDVLTSPLWKTDIEIALANPELNTFDDRGMIADDSYRIYLNVKNTNKDIDLYTVNQSDGMIDSNGYPFGLIVPDSWQWPLERQNINDAYPLFEEYRAWLSGESEELSYAAEHWYLSPTTTEGIVVDDEKVEAILNSAE